MFRLFVLASLLLLFSSCATMSEPVEKFSREQLVADIDQWERWLFATHPKAEHTMDIEQVREKFTELRAQSTGTRDVRTAWLALSPVNVLFRDAHVGLRLPDKAFETAKATGAVPFPSDVTVTNGRIFLKATPNLEIVSINGLTAEEITATLTPRLRGEDKVLQERILSLRFPLALWTLAGDQSEYEVLVRDTDGDNTPELLDLRDQAAPEQSVPFSLSFNKDTAILRVDTFNIAIKEAFTEFVDQSFADIARKRSTRLLIDLRENGGGAHDVSDQLMAYLTAERHTPISAVTARIVPENQALIPGSEPGQVINTPFAQWITPPAELENRFDGRVGILIGPGTYSQAIAFSVTAVDFDLATTLGTPTSGYANQTAQVQRHTLQNTGFDVQAPIYVFTRPSGDTSLSPVTPDIWVPGRGDKQLKDAVTALW